MQVFVSGVIDDDSAKVVCAQLLYLDRESPGEAIHLNINSSGGKVYAGLAIYGVMRSLHSPVHTTCLGHCESMAAVLLAAGEPGERCALPHARVMIHQPVRGASAKKSNAKELATHAAETERSRKKLAELIAADTKRPVEEVRKTRLCN